jgi:hypothetical protein
MDTGETESVLGEEGDDVGGEFLSGVELEEGALAVDPAETGQEREAAEEGVVLEALDVELEKGGRLEVGGLEEGGERRDGDFEGGDFGGAGKEGGLRGGDGQQRGGIVTARDVEGALFGGGAERGLMERDLGVVREDAAEDSGGSGEGFEGDDAGVRGPVADGERKLAAVGADVDDGGEIGREDEAMLDAGEDAMLENDAGEARRAKDLRDFGEFRQRRWVPGILIETDGVVRVRSGDEGVADSCIWD